MTVDNWLTPETAIGARLPEGVWVTRADLVRLYGDKGHEFAAALGIPPEPPKVAPWEAAFREWEALGMTDAPHWSVWKAAWAACEQHYNIATGGEA